MKIWKIFAPLVKGNEISGRRIRIKLRNLQPPESRLSVPIKIYAVAVSIL